MNFHLGFGFARRRKKTYLFNLSTSKRDVSMVTEKTVSAKYPHVANTKQDAPTYQYVIVDRMNENREHAGIPGSLEAARISVEMYDFGICGRLAKTPHKTSKIQNQISDADPFDAAENTLQFMCYNIGESESEKYHERNQGSEMVEDRPDLRSGLIDAVDSGA